MGYNKVRDRRSGNPRTRYTAAAVKRDGCRIMLHTHRTNQVAREASDRGSYLLILSLSRGRRIPIGRLGNLRFEEGFYLYVGSAMKALTKRINRHRRIRKKRHWHIDDLRAFAQFHSAWAVRSSDRLECEIARKLEKIADWTVPGFGSSDCSCGSHLFGMRTNPLFSNDFHQCLQHFRMDRFLKGESLQAP